MNKHSFYLRREELDVTDRQTGLRFDIYERVHLGEDTAAIKELDEVELVPHIQVYTEEEQALLKGHLYLTGSYQGEAGEEQRTLEHLIPVEITLPLNRIQDVSQVSVDIDSFDVDLLNSRSLNVTGVLTLHGIEMLSVPEESWREEEETIFVHEAPSYGDISPVQTRAADEAETWREAAEPVAAVQWEEPSPWAPSLQTAGDAWRVEPQPPAPAQEIKETEKPEEPAAEKYAAMESDVSEIFLEADDENENAEWLEPMENAAAETPNPVPDVEAPAQEEKKEMKIAFGSKSTAEANESSQHLKSLLHTNDYRSPAAVVVEEEAPVPGTDALEWRRLFTQGEEEERRFSRVRVCIVQKEETLDSIAARYGLNPREIQLYNRLADSELPEGKAIFIPV